MPLDDLADYLRVKGRNRFPDSKQVAESIQKAARSSYRLDKVVEDSIDAIPGTSITLIRTFEKQIKDLDKTIERIMKGIPQTLQTIPGVEPVFTADDTSLSRNGNQYLRYYLVEAANSVRRQIPEYRDYYAKKYQEIPKHQHKRALVLTTRKFVRLADALLRKNQIYTPGRDVPYEA